MSDLDAKVIVVEHRDWLARFAVESLAAVVPGRGCRVVAAGTGEMSDDLATKRGRGEAR